MLCNYSYRDAFLESGTNDSRFINLHNGDGIIATADARESDSLPVGVGLVHDVNSHIYIVAHSDVGPQLILSHRFSSIP